MNNVRGVTPPPPNSLERRAAAAKERRDRKWARDNYRSFQTIDPNWSNAIRNECDKINAELGSSTRMIDED